MLLIDDWNQKQKAIDDKDEERRERGESSQN
jgi:hypothetical protein